MVISSIDLMEKKVVQLRRGREKVLEIDDAVSLAKDFDFSTEVAVIDLDAALMRGDNSGIIRDVCKVCECRVGGGIRDINRAKELLSYGAKKVIFSSRVFENNKIDFNFLEEAIKVIGKNRIIIAIDSLGEKVHTQGWVHNTGLNLYDVATKVAPFCSEILYTHIDKEGTMEGIDIDIVKRLRSLTNNRLVVAGGISSLEEIRAMSEIDVDVQLGMSLYTKKISLEDAFISSIKFKDGLIPTITQDYTGRVLMLAYSNEASIRKTFRTKLMSYFSRSKGRVWTKGEESGNIQNVIRIRADCDRDSILSTVYQKGCACHTGSYSCFGDRIYDIYELYEIIEERIKGGDPNSYTASLTEEKLREKIVEEALEVVRAVDRKDKIWECADVLYFLAVFMAKEGIGLDEVFSELRRRRFK
ncbi:MAG: phosphoribosyl-AMP cyclohydrolase [Deltaproteobacteria bacterium]|nr:phosphoribosyl-AMP cyclohydrolase [Deltaproteobacteria bacterium]